MKLDNLLIEIGTEELPPKSLASLASSFAASIETAFKDSDFNFLGVQWYASPRRLAVVVKQLSDVQKDRVIEKRGPSVSAAFAQDGKPTPAAMGWAKSNGISIEQTSRLKTDKGEWLYYEGKESGQAVAGLICPLVEKALKALPIPKPMKWGSNSVEFIRPVHTVTVLFGEQLIEGKVLNINSSRVVKGHRFQGEKQFLLDNADNYLSALKAHYVIADFAERKAVIRAAVMQLAEAEDAQADMNEELLDEVCALVEWPVALLASFESSFLEVPKEALIYTMKGDQKYFPLLDKQGNLKSRFIFISNIDSKQPELIISGNEKVIRPRLSDAQFFFNTDKKQSLASRLDSLNSILFQKQLGTLFDKSQRIAQLSGLIAELLGADRELAHRAGLLSKTDLMTSMVMEFPDVQGVMGMHYALHDGEDPQVAHALNEQYKPRFSGDSLPDKPISMAVALADKIDTLVGIFGIGQIPKGDKDPFALRRASIGVLRIIVENNLPLDLNELVRRSVDTFADKVNPSGLQDSVVDFILARFKAWYLEQGIGIDVIQAVAEMRPTRPADFAARIQAISLFKSNPAAEALAAANKRVANILAKNDVALTSTAINHELLHDAAEAELVNAISGCSTKVEALSAQANYSGALTELALLREPIDNFFDKVMVMADDAEVRKNRLCILNKLRQLFLSCADISFLSQ